MNPQIILYIITALLFSLTLTLNWKFNILKDSSIAIPRPYSWARVQMAWWSMIVLSCLFSIVFAYRAIPNLSRSTEILYGLGLAVALASGMVDSRQDANPEIKNDKISRNQPSQGFWVDILSDNNGMSWPRLQNVLCNLGFGLYFLYCTWYNLALPFHPAIGKTPAFTIDDIMPVINDSSLFMMGISNVAYVGFKVNENKPEAK